jgi:hypothetical protein
MVWNPVAERAIRLDRQTRMQAAGDLVKPFLVSQPARSGPRRP